VEITDDIVAMLNRLARLSPRQAVFADRLMLTAKARAYFEEVRKEVYDTLPALDGRERDWYAKAPAHILRVAGTLTLLQWAYGDGNTEPRDIKVQYVERAAQLVLDYFWPHARAALRQIGLSEHAADARRVLKWIAAKKAKQVSREQIRREALARSHDANETQALLERLVKAGWLKRTTERTSGRPNVRWKVNPQLMKG
jgi:hypothetical protein